MPIDDNRLALRLEGLMTSIDVVGKTIAEASSGLQIKIGRTAEFVTKSMDKNIGALVASLDKNSEAATRAAIAAERHARGLVFATWALAFATIALVIVTLIRG